LKNQPPGNYPHGALMNAERVEETESRLSVRIGPSGTGFAVSFVWSQAGRPPVVARRRVASRQDCHDLAVGLARRLGLGCYDVEDNS
jgi:hypothetical protein